MPAKNGSALSKRRSRIPDTGAPDESLALDREKRLAIALRDPDHTAKLWFERQAAA
jgi:hypothetical protein